MNRRTFVAAAAGASANGAPQPAAQGGTPVRATPLRARYFGPQYYDEKERAAVDSRCSKRGRPFRWYGPG